MDAPEAIAEDARPAALSPLPQPSLEALACLRRLAHAYVWWKTPDEAMLFPQRVAAQVMKLGTWNDLTELIELAGRDYLREVLRNADTGQLDPRSWHY